MDRTIIIEAAQQAADGVAHMQLWSSIIIGLAAVGVPAAFALIDRRSKHADARLRARSFSLAHLQEIEYLTEYLAEHAEKNPLGARITDHGTITFVVTQFAHAKLPAGELYLLGDAADPVQRAFALVAEATSYAYRRERHASAGMDIMLMDQQQSELLHQAYSSMEEGLTRIRHLLR